MKILRPFFLAALAVITLLGAQASADELTFVEDIPTDILFGTVAGATGEASEFAQGSAGTQSTFGFRNLDPDNTAGTRSRGQSFTFVTGDGLTHDIGSLSLSLNGPSDDDGFRPDGQLEFTVFEWDSSNPEDFAGWNVGTGGEFASGHVELYRQSFPILSTDSWGSGDLVQISFDPGQLQLVDGTTYGFLFNYTLSSLVDEAGDPLDADITFAFDVRQDNNLPGALLNTNFATSFDLAVNGQSDPRDMNFFFTSLDTEFLLGDINQDESVDFLDIGPFISLLTNGEFQLEADINQDGEVTFLDIAPFITLLAGG